MTIVLLAAALLQLPRLASIEGIVTEAGTSQPVARAVVELRGGDSEPIATITGADGKFEFRNVAAGRHQLTSTRQGYLEGKYGQRGPNGTGTALPVEAGQNISNVRLVMMATGAISGRVFDNNGEPLANISVQAFKYAYKSGERTLAPLKIDQTNDRGEYRLFWLPPGQYYISATPASSQGMSAFVALPGGGRIIALDSHGMPRNGDRSAAERLGAADVPVYYPGTPELQSAAPVEVRPGSDINGVDFVLSRVKTQKIEGITVHDSRTGERVSSGNVTLVPRNGSIPASTWQ